MSIFLDLKNTTYSFTVLNVNSTKTITNNNSTHVLIKSFYKNEIICKEMFDKTLNNIKSPCKQN